jgi:hypothetical protein
LIADDFDDGETEHEPAVVSHEPSAEHEPVKLEEPTSEPG